MLVDNNFCKDWHKLDFVSFNREWTRHTITGLMTNILATVHRVSMPYEKFYWQLISCCSSISAIVEVFDFISNSWDSWRVGLNALRIRRIENFHATVSFIFLFLLFTSVFCSTSVSCVLFLSVFIKQKLPGSNRSSPSYSKLVGRLYKMM